MESTIEIPETEAASSSARFKELNLMFQAFRRDPLAVVSLLIIILFVLGAIFAPLLTPYPEQGRGDPNILEKFQPPSKEHPLGTEYLGRDVFARILFGSRSSLSIGFLVVIVANPLLKSIVLPISSVFPICENKCCSRFSS